MFNGKAIVAAALAATAGILTLQGSAIAGTYQALCGGIDCSISITGDRISSGSLSLPSHRVTSWIMGGNSETDVTSGVITTVIFGPLGLLGFAGKKHDYNFTVNGFDDTGKRQTLSFRFINNKPAKQVAAALPGATGLAINEKLSEQEILAYEERRGNQLGGRYLGESQPASSDLQIPTSLKHQTTVALASKGNCWTTYLNRNPNMKIRAEANPGAAAQNKRRFDDC